MPIRVLLVEDNQGDRRLTQEAFLGTNNSIQLLLVSDGAEAIAFLRHEGTYIHAPRPDIIFLDLNLPKMSGREVLTFIKEDKSLRAIPHNYPDHFPGRSGYFEKLSTQCQLLPQQTRTVL